MEAPKRDVAALFAYTFAILVPLVVLVIFMQLMATTSLAVMQHVFTMVLQAAGFADVAEFLEEEMIAHHLGSARAATLLGFATADADRGIFWEALKVNAASACCVALFLGALLWKKKQRLEMEYEQVDRILVTVATILYASCITYGILSLLLPQKGMALIFLNPVSAVQSHAHEAPILHLLHGDMVCIWDAFIGFSGQFLIVTIGLVGYGEIVGFRKPVRSHFN